MIDRAQEEGEGRDERRKKRAREEKKESMGGKKEASSQKAYAREVNSLNGHKAKLDR